MLANFTYVAHPVFKLISVFATDHCGTFCTQLKKLNCLARRIWSFKVVCLCRIWSHYLLLTNLITFKFTFHSPSLASLTIWQENWCSALKMSLIGNELEIQAQVKALYNPVSVFFFWFGLWTKAKWILTIHWLYSERSVRALLFVLFVSPLLLKERTVCPKISQGCLTISPPYLWFISQMGPALSLLLLPIPVSWFLLLSLFISPNVTLCLNSIKFYSKTIPPTKYLPNSEV